ncbi:MAG: hypothetical protein MUF34_27930, partial [Polyangiaceae bacterium]|nr:hypothetical protein [Polyangiaceae bacterium]
MKTITLGLLGATLVAAMAVGCGDDDDDTTQLTGGSSGVGGGAGASSGTGGAAAGTAGAVAGRGGAGGTGGQSIGTVTVLASFDAALGELPEGIAVDGSGTPYVGFAPKAEIVELRPDGSSRSSFAKLPAPPPDGQGFMTGLALDAAGNLYAALASFKADVAAPGVYRVPSRRGG